MAERCTVVTLPVATLDDAAQDPALAALLAEGWGVVGSVVVVPPGGSDPLLKVLLSPPRAQGGAGVPWQAALGAAALLAAAMLAGNLLTPLGA
jgi:hypothetical protein